MKKETKDLKFASGGFTLVEITLALMVAAIGLLAVFGLIGDSLRANTKTLDDTIAATFAESVFSAIYAYPWDADQYNILMADGQSFWDHGAGSGSTVIHRATGPDDIRTNKYTYNAIDYYTLRYCLEILESRPAPASTAGQDVWRSWRLRVWIGEFADTSPENAYEFYSEQYRFVDPYTYYEGGSYDGSD